MNCQFQRLLNHALACLEFIDLFISIPRICFGIVTFPKVKTGECFWSGGQLNWYKFFVLLVFWVQFQTTFLLAGALLACKS
jgi:hypothetical protein